MGTVEIIGYYKRDNAYHEWLKADNEWQAELQRVYRSHAGDARYDERGYATPRLQELKTAFIQAGIAHQRIQASKVGNV